MATVRVQHTIGDLARDLTRIGSTAQPKFARAVRRNTEQGNKLARKFARGSSGPHGVLYYKRITSEMLSPLEGEYGPTGDVAGNAVGAGWRHGPPNTDLPKSADVIGPKFAEDVGSILDGLFW